MDAVATRIEHDLLGEMAVPADAYYRRPQLAWDRKLSHQRHVDIDLTGNDVAVSFAVEGGQLQLNAFERIIGRSLFESFKRLRRDLRTNSEIRHQRCCNIFIGLEGVFQTLQGRYCRGIGKGARACRSCVRPRY